MQLFSPRLGSCVYRLLPCEQRLHFHGMSWRAKSSYFSHASDSYRENVASARRVTGCRTDISQEGVSPSGGSKQNLFKASHKIVPVIFISHNGVKTLQLAETEIKNASPAADRVRLLILYQPVKKKKNYFGMRDSHVTDHSCKRNCNCVTVCDLRILKWNDSKCFHGLFCFVVLLELKFPLLKCFGKHI